MVDSGSDGGFLLKISRTLTSDPVGPSRTPMCPWQRPALVRGHSSEASRPSPSQCTRRIYGSGRVQGGSRSPQTHT